MGMGGCGGSALRWVSPEEGGGGVVGRLEKRSKPFSVARIAINQSNNFENYITQRETLMKLFWFFCRDETLREDGITQKRFFCRSTVSLLTAAFILWGK